MGWIFRCEPAPWKSAVKILVWKENWQGRGLMVRANWPWPISICCLSVSSTGYTKWLLCTGILFLPPDLGQYLQITKGYCLDLIVLPASPVAFHTPTFRLLTCYGPFLHHLRNIFVHLTGLPKVLSIGCAQNLAPRYAWTQFRMGPWGMGERRLKLPPMLFCQSKMVLGSHYSHCLVGLHMRFPKGANTCSPWPFQVGIMVWGEGSLSSDTENFPPCLTQLLITILQVDSYSGKSPRFFICIYVTHLPWQIGGTPEPLGLSEAYLWINMHSRIRLHGWNSKHIYQESHWTCFWSNTSDGAVHLFTIAQVHN